jgi:phage gp36-like protein
MGGQVPVVASPWVYCQPSDLALVGALPTFVQSLTAAQQIEAIQTASALMDSYFVARFTLPLVQCSYDVVQCCAKLAIFFLVQARGYNPLNPAELVYETTYNQQIKWLKDVANGQATPQVTDSSPSAAPGLPTPTSSPNAVSPTSSIVPGGISWGTWARR